MRDHLTARQFVDALDGRLESSAAAHLRACRACAVEVAALQRTTSEARGARLVPEPSPLFWDHFGRRVRQATFEERPAPAPWWERAWRPFVAPGALAGAVVLAVAVAMSGRSGAPDLAVTAGDPGEPAAVASLPGLAGPVGDAPVAVMSALAGDLSWQEAKSTNLLPRRTTGDLALAGLTETQRRELARLFALGLGDMEQQ